MAVSVKKAKLWRKELDNRPGTLARALAPLGDAGVNLQTVMGYRFPSDEDRAAVEVWPIEGKKAEDAARKGGLQPFGDVTCLIVEGDDRSGLGARISQALAEAGINIAFVMTLVSGKKYVSVMGFDTDRDAEKAMPLIKRANLAVAGGKKGAKRKSTVKKVGKAAQHKAVTKAGTGAKKSSAKKAAGAKKIGTAKKTGAAKKTTAKKTAAKKTMAKKTANKAGAKKGGTKKSAGSRKPGRKAKSKKA